MLTLTGLRSLYLRAELAHTSPSQLPPGIADPYAAHLFDELVLWAGRCQPPKPDERDPLAKYRNGQIVSVRDRR